MCFFLKQVHVACTPCLPGPARPGPRAQRGGGAAAAAAHGRSVNAVSTGHGAGRRSAGTGRARPGQPAGSLLEGFAVAFGKERVATGVHNRGTTASSSSLTSPLQTALAAVGYSSGSSRGVGIAADTKNICE